MPPTSSAKVFEWLKNVKDPTRWDRTPVLKKERQDILDYYGSQQKRYDAWENEWDCCELFGPLDPDQEVDYDDLCAGHDETDPNKNAACPPPPVEGFADVSEDNSDDIPSSSPLQVRAVAEILSIHYGFVPPLSLSASPTSIDEIQQNKFLRSIGHTHSDGSLFSSNLGSQAIRFVQTLVNRHRPSADSWDLDHTNRKALISVPRLKYLRRIGDELLMLDLKHRSSVPWKLAVTCAADALLICRLGENLDEYEIARHLVEEGIQFRTLLCLRQIPRQPPKTEQNVLPIRLPGYKFTREDYDTYVQQRAVIFTQPRARAALLRGGLIWRLGIETLSINDALRGPSVAVTVERCGFSCPISDVQMWDDDLTPYERDLVCGVYMCYTGMNISLTLPEF
jgi:hypothetical protein